MVMVIVKNIFIVVFFFGFGFVLVDNGFLNQLFGYLFYMNLNIDVVLYQGLVMINICLVDFVVVLGVGLMQELLLFLFSLGIFFNVVILVVLQFGLVGVLVGGVGVSNVLLFGSDLNVLINIGDGGVLLLGLLQVLVLVGNEQVVFNVIVNVFDFFMMVVQIVNSQLVVNVVFVVFNILGFGMVLLLLKIIEFLVIVVGLLG